MILHFKRLAALAMIVLCFSSFPGCEKRMGEIEEAYHEIYYAETIYYGDRLNAELLNDVDNEYTVLIESEESTGDYIDSPPGSMFIYDMSEDEYNLLIDDKPVFEANFRVITAADPSTGKLYTAVTDEDTETALRQILANSDSAYEGSTEEINEYIKKWKLIYYKL